MQRKILLGLTTTPKSDWREKVKEIDKFNIKEIALFPTFLEIDKRKELYDLLSKTSIKTIPHVHLRHDTEEWELDFFQEKYNTRLFNMHYNKQAINFMLGSKHRGNIFLENLREINKLYLENIPKCGGICLDVSHWNGAVFLGTKSYAIMENILDNYTVGCCHVSAESREPYLYVNPKNGKETLVKDDHWLDSLSQLDYVSKYVKYLPEHISIELENSFKKQLEVKKYLEKLINNI